MRLIVGIIILVSGIALLAGSLAVPALKPLVATGVGFIIIGLALTGLSFIKLPDLDAGDVRPLSFLERLASIFFEPSAVFQNLRLYPRWLDALLVVCLMMGIYSVVFIQRMTPEVIAQALTEKSVQAAESFTQQPLPKEAKDGMREGQLQSFKTPAGQISQVLSNTVANSILALLCGAFFTLLALAFGGKMNYWQGVAVVVHSWLPVEIVKSAVNLITLFIKPVEDISPIRGLNGVATTDLGSLLINPAESPALFTLLGLFGVFGIYQLWLYATGLKNSATKLSGGAAWGIALTLFIIIGLAKVILAKVFPGFVA